VAEFDYDVFLSFASLNESLARSLYEWLTGSGLRVFWSDETLKKRVGQSWFRVIEESLEASKHMVLLWSEEAQNSKFVQMEYETFRSETIQDDDRLLIPSHLNGYGPEHMPLSMRHLQCYSLDGDLKDLISSLGGRYEQLEIQNEKLRQEVEALKEHIEILEADRRTAHESAPEHVAELDELKVRYIQLEKTAQQTARLLKEKDSQLLAYEQRIKEIEEKPTKSTKKASPKPSVKGSDRFMTDDHGIEFVLIQPGLFMMGSEDGYDNEKPVHKVEITIPYYLSRYPITQLQWEGVMGQNPSEFKGTERPVERISWRDVQAFLKRLKQGEDVYRLPTEAEWEYACPAGTTTAYSFGDDANELDEYACYGKNSNRSTQPVGQKKPNPWGLYDMHGNVWEWVQDWYASDYYGQFQNLTDMDPRGPENGARHVFRGGSWLNYARSLRSAKRDGLAPGYAYYRLGFRLLRTIS